MNQIFPRIVFLVLLLALSISCSDPNSFNEKFKLDDEKSQEEFIDRLENSDLNYKVGKDGYIHHRSSDREAIHNLALKAGEPSFPVPVNVKSWKTSQETAKNIVLEQYPSILESAHMVGPVTATIQTNITGFAKTNEEVWHLRIICNKGGTHALFFVHPGSGQPYAIKAPGSKKSIKCS